MKVSAKKKMLIAILVGMMFTATLTIISVNASPAITITISPDSGPVGTTVTVSGDNATAGGEVRVYVGIFFFAFFNYGFLFKAYSIEYKPYALQILFSPVLPNRFCSL